MAVQVLAGPVIPHSGARVGVTGRDLDIPEVDASIEHGRDEGMAGHVRVCPGDLNAGGFGEVAQAAGGCVPVHTGAAAVEQDRSAQQALGTTTKKDTVNAALREVTALTARRRDLQRLTSRGLPDLEEEDVMRAAWQR